MHDSTIASEETIIAMPCGGSIDLDKPRSAGPLSATQVAFCRENNIDLAYDPIQIGWIPVKAPDDIVGDMHSPVYRRTALRTHSVTGAMTNLTLRPWRASDTEVYHALLDDPAVWAHMPTPYPNPLTPDAAAVLIELCNSSNHHEVRAILKGDTPIGQVRLEFENTDDSLGGAEISYWLGRAYWGNGYGSAIVTQYAARSFAEHPSLMSIFARVHKKNAASRRVLESAGFRLKGDDPRSENWLIMRKRRD